MIEYHEIYKAYDVPVLRGVDLTVADGEIVAVVGRSGSGKSVLLKTTIGLVVPDYGDVLIDGESVFHSPPERMEHVRRKVGFVFQNAALFDSMTVFENVAQGLTDRLLRQLPRAEVVARVAESLEQVDLDPAEVFAKLPSELSGGMKKRVGVARALVGRPRILLYDEPVTGLDPITSAIVHRLITKLREAIGGTAVMVTHDVEGALRIADRIALLEEGLIRFVGTPDAFRSSVDPLVHAFAGAAETSKLALALEAV